VLENQSKPSHYPFAKTIAVENGRGIEKYIGDGWSIQENTHRWTDGNCAKLKFNVPELGSDSLVLRLNCLAYLAERRLDHQTVTVLVNDFSLTEWQVRDAAWFEVIILNALLRNGNANATLLISDPTAPFEINLSEDKQKLGVCGMELEKFPIDNPVAQKPE